jgi:DNA-binding transcriptional MerR regulator
MSDTTYTTPVVCQLLGLTPRQVTYWHAKMAIISAEPGSFKRREYTLGDVIYIYIIGEWRKQGVSVQQSSKLLKILQELFSKLDRVGHDTLIIRQKKAVAVFSGSLLAQSEGFAGFALVPLAPLFDLLMERSLL